MRSWRSLGWLVPCALLVACGSSSSSSGGAVASAAPATTAPSSAASTTVAASGHVPTSCSQVPTALIDPYVGGVASTMSLGAAASGVTCEFANANASSILVVTIGQGNAAAFATARAKAGGGGRTIASVAGLGADAFSIAKGGQPGGLEALDSQGVLFVVTANQSFGKDETLIRQLMSLF